jgi:phytoene desaturase
MNQKAIIVGSGIGGLSTGILLLKKGYSVEIFEKLGVAGGVAGEYTCQDQKFRFDNTASIVIDPQEYDQIFLEAELDPRSYFEFIELDILYQVYFENGMQYALYRDMEKQSASFKEIFQRPLDDYRSFVKEYSFKYQLSDHHFLTKPFCKVRDFVNFQTIKYALRLKPFYTANTAVEKYIKNKKFRNFLLFQCLYMGISPFKLNNIYATVPAVSQQKGILHIKGGMTAYTNALLKAFLHLGGVIHYDSLVDEIEVSNQIVRGIRIDNHSIQADLVISDADYCETISNLIRMDVSPERIKHTDRFQMSCSVFMLRLGLSCKYSNLSVHNVYINQDFKSEIDRVFTGRLPISPPVYIYYPAAVDDHFGDAMHSSMNIMVRVPNLSFHSITWDALTIKTIRNQCLNILRQITRDEKIEHKIILEDYLTPCDLRDRYHCHEGAAFGIGHSLMQSIMFRPQAKSKQIKNLYFVGSSTHPGNGVTMVMKSAKIAVDLIDEAART